MATFEETLMTQSIGKIRGMLSYNSKLCCAIGTSLCVPRPIVETWVFGFVQW